MGEQHFNSMSDAPLGDTGGKAGPTASSTDLAREQAGQVATTTKEQASAVAGTAMEAGHQVASEAREQLGQVTSEARDQLRQLVQQSREELRNQASTQTDRAASNLRSMSDQLAALADGRTDEAGQLVGLVRQGSDKLSSYASRLERGGFETVAGDVRRWARRRPGVFLATAAAAGFAVGRLIRGAQASNAESDELDPALGSSNGATYPTSPSGGWAAPEPYPPVEPAATGWEALPPAPPPATDRYRGDSTVRPAVPPRAVPPDGTGLRER